MKLPGNVIKQDFIEKCDHNSTVLNINYKNSLTTEFTEMGMNAFGCEYAYVNVFELKYMRSSNDFMGNTAKSISMWYTIKFRFQSKLDHAAL